MLDEADEAVLTNSRQDVLSTLGPKLKETVQAVIRSTSETGSPGSLTIDYPLDETVFPSEIVPPTFLWHDPNPQADTWLVDVAFAGQAEHIHVLSAGNPPATGPLDSAVIAPSNEIYRPTPYQASAKSWTPDRKVWEAIKQGSAGQAATVSILGFCSGGPTEPSVVSRGQVSITTSRDPLEAPIFYRDVPLAPALTEKGVIKPLADEAVSLIGWRLRDISRGESRLLLTDVPTCTNCHSFSADGTTLGMDLDGPQGDKGAYVIAPVARATQFRTENVISWNTFPDRPEGQKTIGFLSRISPDGQFAATTLNEAVYVCNFMDYRFLQVFSPRAASWATTTDRRARLRLCPGPTTRSTCIARLLGLRTANSSSSPGPRPRIPTRNMGGSPNEPTIPPKRGSNTTCIGSRFAVAGGRAGADCRSLGQWHEQHVLEGLAGRQVDCVRAVPQRPANAAGQHAVDRPRQRRHGPAHAMQHPLDEILAQLFAQQPVVGWRECGHPNRYKLECLRIPSKTTIWG